MPSGYLNARPTIPVYDAYGGSEHAPDNWIEVAPGRYALSGSSEAQNYDPTLPVSTPDAGWIQQQQAHMAARRMQPNTVHSDPAMALAWLTQNPGAAGGHFLSNMNTLQLAQQQGYAGPALQSFMPEASAWRKDPLRNAPTDLLSSEERARRALLTRLAG